METEPGISTLRHSSTQFHAHAQVSLSTSNLDRSNSLSTSDRANPNLQPPHDGSSNSSQPSPSSGSGEASPSAVPQSSGDSEGGELDPNGRCPFCGSSHSGAQHVQPQSSGGSTAVEPPQPEARQPSSSSSEPVSESSGSSSETELSDEQQKQVRELRRTDQEVRAHEQAHLAAAGQYARGISYEFTQGPDGRQYATGGSVNLDTSGAEDPEETVQKMEQVRAAAMAPAQPSAQDMQIAAEAAQKLAQARAEMAQEQRDEMSEGGPQRADESGESEESNQDANPDDDSSNGASSGIEVEESPGFMPGGALNLQA